MAVHVLPPFDKEANYAATRRVNVFNGVKLAEGDLIPPPPKDRGASLRYFRLLEQLYLTRRITLVKRKEKR